MKRRQDGDDASIVIMGNGNDFIAAQCFLVQVVDCLLFREALSELTFHRRATHNAGLDYVRPPQHLFPQDITFAHGSGEHHGVETVKIQRRHIFNLLLGQSQRLVLLPGAGIDRHRSDHHDKNQPDGNIDLGSNRHLAGKGKTFSECLHDKYPFYLICSVRVSTHLLVSN